MNLLLVHNESASGLPSGESVVFESEAAALQRAGCTVHTYVASRTAGLKGQLRQANVFWSRAAYVSMRQRIKELRPHLVHFHGVLPDLTAAAFAACNDANVPVVQTLHNYRWICVEGGLFRKGQFCDACLRVGPWQGVKNRCSRGSAFVSGLLTANNQWMVASGRLFDRINRFVAVSNFVKTKHLDAGFPGNKITVKYNGVCVPDQRTTEASNADRDEQKTDPGRPLVVKFRGTFGRSQGHNRCCRVAKADAVAMPSGFQNSRIWA